MTFAPEPLRSHFAKICSQIREIKKLKINRNLQTVPFKMMYDMSMLRYRFSNER